MSEETQALCFLAGANSIFYGPKLLTTPNPGRDRDMRCSTSWAAVDAVAHQASCRTIANPTNSPATDSATEAAT
jgi:biotin synthase-like enzyme